MSATSSGSYPIETRAGEIERLEVQGAAMAPDCERMLDTIAVGPGWHCLDIGCGPRGITDLLARRVGNTGRVVGLDMNDGFLDYARRHVPGVEFMKGDAYAAELGPASFDLVHMRFVASTAGGHERLIAEARRLAKRGGTVALQEPDGSSLRCWPPCAAFDRLREALLGAFAGVGADLELARKLYSAACAAGLEDVQFRPFIVGVRAGDAMVDYLPSTIESLRGTVLRLGLLSESELAGLLANCRAHLSRPGTSFTMYTVAQVWGREPS